MTPFPILRGDIPRPSPGRIVRVFPRKTKASPSDGLYSSHDNDLSKAVRNWALENGGNPLLRIALCGYEGEHEFPKDWECVWWKAHGGYGAQRHGYENAARERIWFSPHCLNPRENLFADLDDQIHALRAEDGDNPLWLTALGEADLQAERHLRGAEEILP